MRTTITIAVLLLLLAGYASAKMGLNMGLSTGAGGATVGAPVSEPFNFIDTGGSAFIDTGGSSFKDY